MPTPMLPWKSKPALTEDRLNMLAGHFREIFYDVESLLDTEDDCPYGRGSLFFGRARQRLIRLGTSNELTWLRLTNPGMDVTLEIDGIPFRFFRDDHDKPMKKGFWRRNVTDRLFAPNDFEAVIFRFIVQRPVTDTDELDIYFVGYNALQEPVCEWRYGSVRVLQSIDQNQAEEVHQEAARAEMPAADIDESDASNTGTK
jgi:hypothetical protein